MKKQIKDLKIGDKFKFDMVNPKGFLTLKVIDFEKHTPWCTVIEHFYEEAAEDEYEEEDRYKTGDILPYVYTGDVFID
jgi:hypothetical protein